MPSGITLGRLVEPHPHRRDDRAGGGADRDDADQRRGLRRRVAERRRGPGEHDHAQVARDAPEQRRRRQRDLAELVVPQARVAVREVAHQQAHAVRDSGCSGASVRGMRRLNSAATTYRQTITAIAASGAVAMPVSNIGRSNASSWREITWPTSWPPSSDAEDDRQDRQALDPAVRLDELRVRQQLGQDAVLGRRVRGRAEADDRVGDQRMAAEQHHQAADDLDRVRDEHHRALRHRVGEGADERREDHVEQREHRRQRRDVPGRRAGRLQQFDRRRPAARCRPAS